MTVFIYKKDTNGTYVEAGQKANIRMITPVFGSQLELLSKNSGGFAIAEVNSGNAPNPNPALGAAEVLRILTERKSRRNNDDIYIYVLPKVEPERVDHIQGTSLTVVGDGRMLSNRPPAWTIAQCIGEINTVLRVAQQNSAQVVLLPEYFFTKNDNGKKHMMLTKQEKTQLDASLSAIARENKEMLIVAGTALWFNDNTKSIRNTAMVLFNGSVTGYHKVIMDKQNDSILRDNQGVFGATQPGQRARLDLEFLSLSCRIQICADNGTTQGEKDFDLHFVVSSNLGALMSNAHAMGLVFVADAARGVNVCRNGSADYLKGAFTEIHVFKETVRPRIERPTLRLQNLAAPKPIRTTSPK